MALREYDAGEDPYLTRVDYQVPSVTLKRYRKIMQLEKVARKAPSDVQRRLRVAVFMAIALTVLFFAATVLAALESLVGILFCQILLGMAGALVAVGLVLATFFFVIPYMRVGTSELRGLEELKARPGIHGMAGALGVDVGIEDAREEGQW